MSGSDTVSENPRVRVLKLTDEEAGHIIAALRMCERRAGYAREYGLEGAYRHLLDKVERA